jgi:hypothetical protein
MSLPVCVRLAAAAAFALLLTAAPASALTIVLTGPFLPEGGMGSAGSGFARVTFDTDLLTMHVEATWSGTSSTSTVAHIHCCTAVPNSGNAVVATQVPSFAGFPVGVTEGSYDRLFDMSLAGSWNSAYVTANGGSPASAFTALVNGLSAERGYLNIHTNAFPSGEIRARLALIPEPATSVLLGLGLGLLARRRPRA